MMLIPSFVVGVPPGALPDKPSGGDDYRTLNMMKTSPKYIIGLYMAGLVACIIGLTGCTETMSVVDNDSYIVTVSRFNPSAFDEYVLSVYVDPIRDKRLRKTKILEIEGPCDAWAGFVGPNMLLLKESPWEGMSSCGIHYLFHLPMKCIGTISYSMNSLNDPFMSDTIPYAVEMAGNRIIRIDSTQYDKVQIISAVDTSRFGRRRVVLIAPVEKITGELLGQDTLSLTITWCGENEPEEMLVILPTSRAEDFTYMVSR
jgi:hypothetical protein